MGQDGLFERWAGFVLGAVSLVLALHLAKIYVVPRLDSHPQTIAQRADARGHLSTDPAHSSAANTTKQQPAQSIRLDEKRSALASSQESTPRRARASTHIAAITRKTEFKQSAPAQTAVAPQEKSAEKAPVEVAQSLAAPLPSKLTFDTIGYVEKADGTKQAVVSKGNQVFVVHEGEVFDEHYRVLSISSSQVEAADLTVPQLTPAVAPEPTVLAERSDPPAANRHAEKPATGIAEAKPLGFVERPGRPPEAIFSDGDSVRLVASSATPDRGSFGVVVTASNRDDISLVSSTGQPTSSAAAFSAGTETREGMSGLLSSVPLDKTLTAATAFPTDGLRPSPQAVGSFDSSRLSGGAFRDVSLRSPPKESGPPRESPAEPPRQILQAFCYVERPSTGREAFIALGDKVYSVREGTIIANRYRVVGIRPDGVEVEDATVESRPPPWPNQEVAQNRKLPDVTLELGNHSPPAELPMSELAHSVPFLLTDFATPEVAPAAEPRQLTEIPGEPTLDGSEPSISNVRVGPYERTALFSLTQASGQQSTEAFPGRGDSIPGGDVPDIEPGTLANKPNKNSALSEIALLPLTVSASLLTVPGQIDGAASGKDLPASGPPLIASNGPLPSAASNGALGTNQNGIGIQAGQAQTQSATGLAGVSGRDLLLHFSIGNNGCYFP